MLWILLAMGCEDEISTTGAVASIDIHCGDDLIAGMGHVGQSLVLSLSMCVENETLGAVCDMTPAPGTITHWPAWGFVADCTDYGPDAWMRASYLIEG